MANIVSSCRILLSITLLFCPVFSVGFYCTYILCGFTDMVDGVVARKTNSVSEFGARLDTTSDFIFFSVTFIKLLPIIHIPKWIWVWIVVIAIIKIFNVILGFIYTKKLISLHTVMNKITGLLLFLIPPALQFVEIKYSLIAVCIVATISAIQEGYYSMQFHHKTVAILQSFFNMP
ncbi:MAG: CDP-alcohol phosphatidyltransferase family protein [Clostridia bacterium]|nr:CDP-alcohol phosphatidyltransferase family protein [Clostridia bacterium]